MKSRLLQVARMAAFGKVAISLKAQSGDRFWPNSLETCTFSVNREYDWTYILRNINDWNYEFTRNPLKAGQILAAFGAATAEPWKVSTSWMQKAIKHSD